MATDVSIRFRADSRSAQQEIDKLKREVTELRGQLGQTTRAADAAQTEVQQLGQQSRQAAGGVDKLGDEARETAQEVLLLSNRFRQTGRGATEFSGATGNATRGTGLFTGSVRGLGTVLGALGIAAVTQEIGRFGVESVQAAGRMEQYVRATTQIEGSSEAAQRRIEALIEVANLPGLNFEALTRYSNRLRAAGFAADDTDKILLTVGQTIVSLGGTAEKAALSMEQIIQAIQLGTIDMRDFRTVIQQVPGFLEVLGDVHGVEANISGLREAFNKTGGSMRDLLIPAFDELARRFEGPPADSYIVAMDTLENSIFLLKSTIGDQFLPVVVRSAQGLTEFFEAIRAGIRDTSTLPEPIQEIIAGAQALLEALQNVGGQLIEILGPAVRQLGTEFAGLLGSVLELAGSLLNLLSPVLQGVTAVAATLVSAVAQLADQLSTLITGVSDAVEWITFWGDEEDKASAATDRLTKSVEAATAALEENASVGDKQRARLGALQQELETTNASIARYEAELRKAGEAGVSNRSTEQFERLLQTARERVPELTAEIERLTAAYGGLTAELGTDATAVERQEAKLKDLQTELAAANALVERYEASLAKAREETLGETNSAIEHYARRLEGAKARQAEVNAEIGKAETQLTVLKNATAEATGATDKHTASVKAANVEYVTYRQFMRDATQEIRAFSELNTGLEGFGDFWRVAAGAAGEYATAIHLATVSVTNHAAELEALHNAGFFDGLDDPIADYAAGLQATSEAADNALGPLNRVHQSVNHATADFRNAEARLREFDDAFKLSEATIPRVTSEIQRFAGQVPPATQEVIDFRRELETLNRTGQEIDLSSVAGALDIQASPASGAQLGGRDAYADFLQSQGVRIGEQLASTAIQTAGRLRDIEQDRIESLEQLEEAYSQRIIEINQRKAERLAAVEQEIEEERVRRLAAIEQAFETAANAEVAARQRSAEQIDQIEARAAEQRQQLRERLSERLIQLERRRDDRIQDLNDGLGQREAARQQQILEITEQAAAARLQAEQTYADRVQEINNRLVEDVRAIHLRLREDIDGIEAGFTQRQADRAAEIVAVTDRAAADRAALHAQYTETMEGIYRDLVDAWDALEKGFTERQEARAQERVEIERDAAAARADAYETYNQAVARISTDLVDEVRGIQDEITEVIESAAADRVEIEQEAIDARVDANRAYRETIEDIESERDRQLEANARRAVEIEREANVARLRADEEYARDFQDIQNQLVDEVVGIQRGLHDTLNDLREDALDAEQDRLDSLVALHEETARTLADLERDRNRSEEDIRRDFQQDQLDNATQLDRALEDADSDEDRERAIQRFNRRQQDLTRDYHRDILEVRRRTARQQEDIARRAAEREIAIAAEAERRKAEIAETQRSTRAQAQADIATAESQAGVSFQEAQANYVPALSAHEQALAAHTQALQAIAAQERTDTEQSTAERAQILQDAFDATAEAGTTLSETLSSINTGLQESLGGLARETAGTVGGLNQQIATAEGRAGLSFEQALENYTPVLDLNTQALNTLTETLSGIDAEAAVRRSGIDAAGRADRAGTTAAQAALETEAGVGIAEARANFVPALSSAAEATLTLNTSIQSLEQSFRQTIQDIHTAGLVDRQAVSDAVAAAIAEAQATQRTLESQAGVSFAEALRAFQPGISAIGQAGADRSATLTGIDAAEQADLDSLNAQSLADRLETDAEITAARDAYIKARDAQILQHNTAILQLNQQESIDIAAVKMTLQTRLQSIDTKLDTELEEIRAAKMVFDTRISEVIDAINEEANADVRGLKADTIVMRRSLETIASEARNNAWKDAIANGLNVTLTVAGAAAGAVVGGPAGVAAGAQIGGAIGGLAQQGVNELFHFPETDRIARSIARAETLRRRRETPDYLPSREQIQNSRDVSREIVAGIQEAQRQAGGGQAGPETGQIEFNPTIVINLDGEQVGTARVAEIIEEQNDLNALRGRNIR